MLAILTILMTLALIWINRIDTFLELVAFDVYLLMVWAIVRFLL